MTCPRPNIPRPRPVTKRASWPIAFNPISTSQQTQVEQTIRTAQLLDDLGRDALLEVHLAVDVARRAARERVGAPRGDAEARRVERGLRGEPTEHVQEHLDVALRLGRGGMGEASFEVKGGAGERTCMNPPMTP